jgi:hypothetical protein
VSWVHRTVDQVHGRGSLVHHGPMAGVNRDTTKNTVIGCALSEVVLCELHLKHYQERFISSYPFQLLGAVLSEVVLHVELLLIIL